MPIRRWLTAFDSTVNSQWNGAKPPVDFCSELLAANEHRGVALPGPDALAGAQLERQSPLWILS